MISSLGANYYQILYYSRLYRQLRYRFPYDIIYDVYGESNRGQNDKSQDLVYNRFTKEYTAR